MAETLLDRLVTHRRDQTGVSDFDPDEQLNLGSFGWLRGVRDRAIMLEFRFKNGKIMAFNYAWLERADFDPSTGILLKFAGAEVRLIGRNLNAEPRPTVQLFPGIIRHRITWIAESSGASGMAANKEALVIESISVV